MSAELDPDLYDGLRLAILRGEYVFGSRLKIDELARRYGVSHMPVRKALLQLAGDGLVTIERNRGASVRPIDLESVSNIYEIVLPLEALLSRRAALRTTPAVLVELACMQDEFERLAAIDDQAGVADTNRQFHELVNGQAGNPEAAHIVNRYQGLLRAFRRAYGFDGARLPGVIADHRALIAALREADAEGAAAIAAGHAAKARNDLIATIRGGPPRENHKKPRERKS